jgi:lipoprotein-anchoring transpeptidase ErfK/SrfK
MNSSISRRDFLKLSALGMGSLAFTPKSGKGIFTPSDEIGRVATTAVPVYSEPYDKSTIVSQRFRDELVNIYQDVISDKGPGYNPLWYRVWQGYIHSAHVVKVRECLNPVMDSVPETDQLVEVTVPYSQSFRYTKAYGWQPTYRLYYGSLHWVTAIDEGPDGQPWYRIRDELLAAEHENYHASAVHFRPVMPEEYTPLSTDVPPEKKRIEVDLSTQRLVAYEYDKEVFKTTISSGIPHLNLKGPDTDTPRGTFNVYSKLPSKHMGEGYFTDDLEAYILPGVPWTSFFTNNGVGFHGTYWHNNFGMTMSHGCINMKTEEAKWIFRWTTPSAPPNTVETDATGTLVKIY